MGNFFHKVIATTRVVHECITNSSSSMPQLPCVLLGLVNRKTMKTTFHRCSTFKMKIVKYLLNSSSYTLKVSYLKFLNSSSHLVIKTRHRTITFPFHSLHSLIWPFPSLQYHSCLQVVSQTWDLSTLDSPSLVLKRTSQITNGAYFH